MLDPREWSFDIDRYANKVVPPPPWRHIPYPVARFFGHRKEDDKPKVSGNLQPIFWAFIGIFCGIALIEGVDMHVPSLQAHQAPLIVGSFGAAAVLEFYAIESPLAQPRNAIFGQLISCVVGIAVAKLFQLSDDFEKIRWLGGALACAAATSCMALTKTVHPPAGATALLAVTDDGMVHMGWFLIPMVLLGCGLMLVVALLVNNISRRFPVYWWTPEELRQGRREMFLRRGGSSHKGSEAEVQEDEGQREPKDVEAGAEAPEPKTVVADSDDANCIVIRPGQVVVPEHLALRQEEKLLLETMCSRL